MSLWQLGHLYPAKVALQQAISLSPPLPTADKQAAQQTLDKLASGAIPTPASGSTS